ncbi:C-type lectin 37Db-like [Diorhabda carinulata]|uniref:C-type lectin 37Db-like n=1 Tax=Diorhabda carinulata TaxID=1163345 RepID=UPI0025A05E6D|nr:C-type lectin 37Db-like [Diorhabda carinulata]
MLFKTIIVLVLWNLCHLGLGENATEFLSPVLNRPNKRFTNRFSSGGKSYYVDTVFKTNFFKAMQFCRQQGMQLLSISSREEDNRIGNFLRQNGLAHRRYWTSGTNFGDRNQWIWLSTGQDFTFTNWPPGEPSFKNTDHEENCVEYLSWGKPHNGFAWNDIDCMKEFYFICESSNDCSTANRD